jgi:hypothetical protein
MSDEEKVFGKIIENILLTGMVSVINLKRLSFKLYIIGEHPHILGVNSTEKSQYLVVGTGSANTVNSCSIRLCLK